MHNFDFIKILIKYCLIFNLNRNVNLNIIKNNLDASLFIKSFSMILKAQHGAPWFERFQHDKQNKTKQTTFLNEY